MAYAIKAEMQDPQAETFVFAGQKTMYGGKRIEQGDIPISDVATKFGCRAASKVEMSPEPVLRQSAAS